MDHCEVFVNISPNYLRLDLLELTEKLNMITISRQLSTQHPNYCPCKFVCLQHHYTTRPQITIINNTCHDAFKLL